MLFVELALIRWVGANNVFVNKATNFVLLASFLGIGIGFLNARARRDYLALDAGGPAGAGGLRAAFPVVLSTLSGPPVPGLGRHARAAAAGQSRSSCSFWSRP